MRITLHRTFMLLFCLLVGLRAEVAGAVRTHPPAAPQAGNRADGVSVPFIYDPPMTPLPVMMVSINGEPPLPFMLDTGFSAPVLISTWVAEKSKLSADGTAIPADSGHSALLKTRLHSVALVGGATQPAVELGASEGYIMDFPVAAKMFARPRIAGIIGAPLLASSVIRFDFSTRSMTVFASPYLPSGSQVTVLPMTQKPDGYFVHVSSLDGVAADLLLDTGSTATNFPLAAASRLHRQATLTEMWLSVDGSLHFSDTSLLSGLKVGDFDVKRVVVGSSPSADVPTLGLDILSRFRITLDFAKRLLVLERPTDYNGRVRLPGSTGAHLVERAGKYCVESVEAGSSAERAGVRNGDRLLVVDTRQLGPLPVSVAQHVLDGTAGTVARITVQRQNGHARHIACVRQSEFANPHRLNLGLAMEKSVGGPLVILNVDGASAAAEQGLRQGDVIVAWNGQPTAAMTPEQFRTQVRTPRITLAIHREGADVAMIVHLATRRAERAKNPKNDGASIRTVQPYLVSAGVNP